MFNTARKRASTRGRYAGGVCTIVRNKLANYVTCLKTNLHDCIFLLFDGCVFDLSKSVLFCSVYIAPEYSTIYESLSSTNGVELFENELLDILTKLPDVYVIVLGDLNARTGVQLDYIPDDSTKYVIDSGVAYDRDDFELPRVSKDKSVNSFGRSLLSLCCSLNLHIVNGRLGYDAGRGDFTCIVNLGASVVDYAIMSTFLFSRVAKFEVGLSTISDHFPLSLSMNTFVSNAFGNVVSTPARSQCDMIKFVWSPEKITKVHLSMRWKQRN